MGGIVTTVIRPLTLDDLDSVVALEAANQPAPWSEGVFRDELAAENRVYLAADEDGVVGFGGVMLVGEEAHVTNLLVTPERRRRGIARDLMVTLITAAVSAASEGLRTLVVERHAPGGQAGTSARIENYPGFPSGISGAELAESAREQALRFGAEIIVGSEPIDRSIERVPIVREDRQPIELAHLFGGHELHGLRRG